MECAAGALWQKRLARVILLEFLASSPLPGKRGRSLPRDPSPGRNLRVNWSYCPAQVAWASRLDVPGEVDQGAGRQNLSRGAKQFGAHRLAYTRLLKLRWVCVATSRGPTILVRLRVRLVPAAGPQGGSPVDGSPRNRFNDVTSLRLSA